MLAVVTVLGMLAAPRVIHYCSGLYRYARQVFLTSALLRITFPYILLISLASLVGAILNTPEPLLDPGLCANAA